MYKYQIINNGSYYSIINKDTGAIKSRHSSLDKAQEQVRLLEGSKHGTIEKAKKKKPEEERIKFL